MSKSESKHGKHTKPRSTIFSVTDFDISPERQKFYKSLTDGLMPRLASVVFQLEKGKKTERLHLQMMLVYWNQVTEATVQKDLAYPEGSEKKWPHIERARKIKCLERYVQKPDTYVAGPVTYGVTIPNLEKHNRDQEKKDIVKQVQEGETVETIINAHQSHFLNKGVSALKAVCAARQKYRTWVQALIVITGVSGLGKTKLAETLLSFMFDDWSEQEWGEEYWDNINYGQAVLFDEFEGDGKDYKKFKILTNRGKASIKQKNVGRNPFAPPLIILCGEKPVDSWYPRTSRYSIYRRVTVLFELQPAIIRLSKYTYEGRTFNNAYWRYCNEPKPHFIPASGTEQPMKKRKYTCDEQYVEKIKKSRQFE